MRRRRSTRPGQGSARREPDRRARRSRRRGNATLDAGRLLDRRTTGVALTAKAVHITGAVEAGAKLTGDIDGQPLSGSGYLAKRADGGWTLDNLALSLASASLSGAISVGADRHRHRRRELRRQEPRRSLAPGSHQARRRASGQDHRLGRRRPAVRYNRREQRPDERRRHPVQGLKVNMAVADLWGARAIAGVRPARPRRDRRQVDRGRQGDGDAGCRAQRSRLQRRRARARVQSARPAVRRDAGPARTRQPVGGRARPTDRPRPSRDLDLDDGLEIQNFALAVDSGRLSLAGHAGASSTSGRGDRPAALRARTRVAGSRPLGVAEGEATISGRSANPSGDWRLRVTGISAPQARNAGLPTLEVVGSGRLSGGRTTVDLAVNAGRPIRFASPVRPRFRSTARSTSRSTGVLDAGLANALLSTGGRHASGALTVAMQLRSALAKPEARGTIALANGTFRDDQTVSSSRPSALS